MKLTRSLLTLCLLLCAMFPAAAQVAAETPEQRTERFTKLKEAAETEAKTPAEALADFESSNDFKLDEGGKELRDKLARRVVDATAGPVVSHEDAAAAGMALDDAGYSDLARALLVTAWKGMKDAGLAAIVVTKDERKIIKANPKFVDVVTRLGWQPYQRPIEMDDCSRLEVEGAAEYNRAYSSVDQTYHDVGLYPPGAVAELEQLEIPALEGLKELKDADKDGYAIKARMAWIRFKYANNNKAKVDRRKGKRSFSPRAMGRDAEAFGDIWTYQHRGPFVVYLEKPFDAELNQREVDECMNLLGQLYEWFTQNMIQPWELRRAKPRMDAELAEKEGWQLEIVLFADKASFDGYFFDANGVELSGGALFAYSPVEERIVGCLPAAIEEETFTFRRSMLAHEAFHYLSDLYAAGPQFDIDDMMSRPRYSSTLVQEGLTDFVSGLTIEGEGADAKHTFAELNKLRLADFKSIYEILGNKPLFRLRDLPEFRTFGQCNQKAMDRYNVEKFKVNPLWLQQVATGAYYATACQACYFFHHYTKDGKYVYRDKLWAFLKDEYQGKHILKGYDDLAAEDAFKEVFEIEDDADWDAIEAEFIEFTLALEVPEPEAPEKD